MATMAMEALGGSLSMESLVIKLVIWFVFGFLIGTVCVMAGRK